MYSRKPSIDMKKRDFLKKSAILTVGGTLAASSGVGLKAAKTAGRKNRRAGMEYELPELPYAYDALEPYIDALTMEIHHDKHHAGYTRKLNAAVSEYGLEDTAIQDLFSRISRQPLAVRNNGGGFYNHKLFWKWMAPPGKGGGGEPAGELLKAIETGFGSYDDFREEFSSAAATRFGSGWAWLVKTDSGLVVTSTPNQDNPLMDVVETRGIPLLGIDVWEHAYYLKYQNRRADYIAAFWNVVNWDFVSQRFNNNM